MKTDYRRTWICCCGGAAIQAISINLPPLFFAVLHTQFSVSLEKIGRLILISFLTQLLIDIAAVPLQKRCGFRVTIVLAHAFTAAGLFLFGILPRILPDAYAGMVLSALVYSVGAGLLEVLISPLADALPSEKKAASMSLVHSFYCWGQVGTILLTTAAIFLFGSDRWWLYFEVAACVPLVNLLLCTRVPMPPMSAQGEPMTFGKLFTQGGFWVMILLMICGGASEQVMAQWASLFAEKGLGVSKVLGDLLGPCLFAVCMGTGRFLHGKSGERVPLRFLLIACAGGCVIAYLMTALVPVPVLALIGCGLCGFSVSLMWPGTISLASKRFPNGSTALFSLLALSGDVGCSVGPWLTGAVSDLVREKADLTSLAVSFGLSAEQFGLKAGLLCAVIFPLVILPILLFLHRRERRKTL